MSANTRPGASSATLQDATPVPPRALRIYGVPVHAADYGGVWRAICGWVAQRSSRSVCFAAVATIIAARDSHEFKDAIEQADLVLPDGMPVVWAMRRSGAAGQARLCGPDLIFRLCADAAHAGIPIGFYGSTTEILDRIRRRLTALYPQLEIRYAYSPPFRSLTDDEEEEVLRAIDASGIGILFVGLGCPKQEVWMASVRQRVHVVMFGIGGAFEVAAGTQGVPPHWMQSIGLQWFYRLSREPRRLWRRYVFHGIRFAAIVIRSRV